MGLEDIIKRRNIGSTMGFSMETKPKRTAKKGVDIQPTNLLKFGLIPEFIGRLPVVAGLTELNEEALIKILVEPKNAIVKQYQRLFDMEGVKLKFTDAALRTVSKQALEKKLGARGLRAILEDIMLDLMYDIPSEPDIKEVVISEDCITRAEQPLIVYQHQAESA